MSPLLQLCATPQPSLVAPSRTLHNSTFRATPSTSEYPRLDTSSGLHVTNRATPPPSKRDPRLQKGVKTLAPKLLTFTLANAAEETTCRHPWSSWRSRTLNLLFFDPKYSRGWHFDGVNTVPRYPLPLCTNYHSIDRRYRDCRHRLPQQRVK